MAEKMTRAERSWVLYDVGNSAFILLVTTTIPIFFKGLAEAEGIDTVYASGLWASVTAASVLILAVLSPFLGAVADYSGMKRRLFLAALALGLAGLAGLCLTANPYAYLALFVAARLGYSACNVFYDAMLTDVTTDARIDRISATGYAWGYIGSCIPFIIGIVLIFTTPFGLSTVQATRLSFALTGAWWGVLTVPLLRDVRQVYCLDDRPDKLRHSIYRLRSTFGKLRRDRRMLFFILSYFFYIDGVYTIMSLATTYGAEVGIDQSQMILALLLTQFVAFPCALLTAKAAEKWGVVRLIRVSIVAYMGICAFGYQLDKAWEFWVLAVAVGMFQGGVQSLSRSHFGKMIPKEEANEYFGLFDIFGKAADFMGPAIVAFCAFVFHSSSFGILGLLILFAVGLALLGKSEQAGD